MLPICNGLIDDGYLEKQPIALEDNFNEYN